MGIFADIFGDLFPPEDKQVLLKKLADLEQKAEIMERSLKTVQEEHDAALKQMKSAVRELADMEGERDRYREMYATAQGELRIANDKIAKMKSAPGGSGQSNVPPLFQDKVKDANVVPELKASGQPLEDAVLERLKVNRSRPTTSGWRTPPPPNRDKIKRMDTDDAFVPTTASSVSETSSKADFCGSGDGGSSSSSSSDGGSCGGD